jgi:N6-L-threonylcarbamoyladenine synthase
VTGNGLRKYADRVHEVLGTAAHVVEESRWLPTGAGLLSAFELARSRGELGDGDPATLLPVYTRLSDAEEAERLKACAAGIVPTTGVIWPEGRE